MVFDSSQIIAQTGTYFITHYNPAEYNFDNTNYALWQDERGVMHIANRQGVLHYDGNSWWLTATPYSIFCLAEAGENMYVGGREGLGLIKNPGNGDSEFISIDTLHRDIIKCVVVDNNAYYINSEHLFSFNLDNPSIIDTITTEPQELLDLVALKGKIYLSTSIGLYEVKGKELTDPTISRPDGDFFIRESPNGSLLHFTDSSDIYTEIDGNLLKLNFDNKPFLEEHTVTEIAWVSDSLIALSTLSGGVIFVNVPSGETEQIVNYDTGLPDNEIRAIYTDKSGGFWVVHPFGFSVISPGLPLRSYNHYPGLKGSLVSVLSYEGQLFVGTTLGVYRLSQIDKIKTYTVSERVRIMVAGENQETEEKVEEVVKKKGLFGLFKKKNRENPTPVVKKQAAPTYKYVYRNRVIEEVVAQNFEFVKIKGINAKSGQLLAYNQQLLTGTVHGVYRLDGDSAYLVNAVPVSYMYGLPGNNLLFVSTMDKEVKVLEYNGNAWRETNMLQGLDDLIEQITLDPEKNIWLCGADSLYRLVLVGDVLTDVEVYHIDNPHFERIYSVNHDGKIHFINSSGYYAYQDRQIIKQDYLEERIDLPKKYILGQAGELWINTGSIWYGANNDITSSLNFLSLFRDPQSVAHDDENNFWVITASNNLYKINSDDIVNISGQDDIYLKEVRNNENIIPIVADMEVDQVSSSLTFEFASPDYSGIYRKEYQFRLSKASGTQSPWSSWAITNNVISYQFLPPGTYTLEARFRNALGKVIEANPFEFKIVAPYWKRPWFYVIELLFFGSLMVFTFYLNRGKGKYSFMSRLLGFLTLILIVEFFQTIAEYKFQTNESPVVNFFLQAFVALLILPVESLIRNWLTKKPKEAKAQLEE